MTHPTAQQIDEAVPANGTPNRAKTNAVLKGIVDSLGLFQHEVSYPAAHDSPGVKGDYAIGEESIAVYIDSLGEWRLITLLGF